MTEYMAQRNINIALTNFSNTLIPPDNFLEDGTSLVQKVFEVLKRKSKFPVDRVFFGGSVGKNTSIICPDFDCTVFINNEEPPFDEIIDDFEDILLMNESLKIVRGSIKTTRFSVQCTFDGGFTLDLLPAANLVKMKPGLGGSELAEAQRKQVMQRIEKNPKNYYYYSSSLGESQLEFMKKQDSFTHQLVRLAKFWYKSLYFGEYITGASTIMELIVVAVAEKDECQDRQSLFKAFLNFLQFVSKIDTLKLAFSREPNGRWRSLTENELRSSIKQGGSVTVKGMPGIEILQRPHFIIEPANPLNDMTEKLSPTIMNKFKKFAEITIKRFMDVDAEMILMHQGKPYLPFHDLFRPLPTSLVSTTFNGPMPPIPRFLISVLDGRSNMRNPDTKIRNAELFKKPEIKRLVYGMAAFFFTTVHSAVLSDPHMDENKIKLRVQQMVDEDFFGQSHSAWTTVSQKHEDYDVTLTVPIPTDKYNKVIVLSMHW